jgi:hypothetical protein
MKERHISREKMQWLEMDILDLNFEDESFDLVIDKGEHAYIDQSWRIGTMEWAYRSGFGHWANEQCAVDNERGSLGMISHTLCLHQADLSEPTRKGYQDMYAGDYRGFESTA